MGWKDGKKPEQYLFTITEDFSDNWGALKEKAKKDKSNISDALRSAVSSKIENNRLKNALILSPHTDDAELGCGGTISKMVEDGWNVHVMYFSAVGVNCCINTNIDSEDHPDRENTQTEKIERKFCKIHRLL